MKRHLHFSQTDISRRIPAKRGPRTCALFLILTVLLQGSYCLAGQSDTSTPFQNKTFTTKHISAEQGRIFLSKLKLGTASRLPGTETILVTGEPDEISRASAVLELVDADVNDPFVFRAIAPASEAKELPSNNQLAATIGNISIGDFTTAPDPQAANRAIIDVHNGVVLLIAPISQVEKIMGAVEKLRRPDDQQILQSTELPGREIKLSLPDESMSQPSLVQEAETTPDTLQTELEVLPQLQNQPVSTAEPSAAPIEPNITQPEKPGKIVQMPGSLATNTLNIPKGEETINLDLPDPVPIPLLLGLAGEYLGLDFLYDPEKVKGDVTIKIQGELAGPIKIKDIYPLLETILKFRNLVMTRRGGLVIVVPIEEALDIDPSLQSDTSVMQQIMPGDVVITKVFTLEHIETTSAENLLKGMKLGVNISAIPEGKKLIVTEFAYRMQRVQELLWMIDRPGEPKKFRTKQLNYTMAGILVEKVKTLAEQLGTVSVTIPELAAEQEFTPTPQQSGESTQIYNARIARERALWLQRRRAIETALAVQPRTPEAATTKPTVYLDADERTNRILMIGLEEQLQEVDELIEALDVEQQDLRTLRLYRVEHVSAEEVRNKLAELGIVSASITSDDGRRGRLSQTGRISEQPSGARVAVPRSETAVNTAATTADNSEEPLLEQPQVVVIEATNSLLVNATAEQHARITSIISYVDSAAEQRSIPYVVYSLENQDPNQLKMILDELIIETTTNEDPEGKIVSTSTRQRTEDEIAIVADPKTYSLIVYASKENQQWIKSLVEQLDEYRPQVLLDVTLVEVTKNEEFTADLDMIRKFPRFEAGETMSGTGLSALLSPFPDGRVFEAASVAGAGGTAFYADRHVQALMELMEKKGYGRILAKPKLLVNDNEEGTITSRETTSIVREQTDIIPGTAAQASTSATSVAFESFDAGIDLIITPHISKGDQLQLAVNLERNDFRQRPDYTITSGDSKRTGPTPPDILTSNVVTKVTVPDGTTIILGGLEKLNQSKGGTKVPILGDIPFIGMLFRNTSNTDSQSRLYVFVKAHILRPGKEAVGEADIRVISQRNQDRFESYERQMQDYADFPGFGAKPMDPLRVLNDN